MKSLSNILVICICLLIVSSCKKLVEVESPITKYNAEKVYQKDASAISVLTNIYQLMSADDIFQGVNSLSFYVGMYADELTDYSGGTSQRNAVYQDNLTSSNAPFWSRYYNVIYVTNTAIQGLNESSTLSPAVKTQLLGEAKFLRAFLYFYLVNLWGDVPLLLTNDYRVNSTAKRSSQDLIFAQMVKDLSDAENLLSSEYLLSDLITTTSERIRPTKWAAKALLARVYLYSKNYSGAESKSSELISEEGRFELPSLNDAFLNTSKEAIWQIQATNPSWNTYDAKGFILSGAPNTQQPVSLTDDLTKSFEPGDQRKTDWVGTVTANGLSYSFAMKYKSNIQDAAKTEALMVFRLGEQYLIRAEARAELGNLPTAVSDLNKIRKRARAVANLEVPNPLPDLSSSVSKEILLNTILHERQVELFTEWGHRFFDLKRSGRLNSVMKDVAPKKGGSWSDFKAFFPIPAGDLQYNVNLTQNAGYN